jgi:hypothetical protein
MDDLFNYNSLDRENFNANIDPNIQDFSKDDYTPILDDPEQGLGNITITKLIFHEEGIFNQSESYPNLVDDLISGALNITYLSTHYMQTTEIAQFNNLDKSLPESDIIKVLINESISVQYNSSIGGSEGYLIYSPRLLPRVLKQVLVQNKSSSIIEELSENEYSLDDDDYIIFDYQNYFQDLDNFHNFSMYFIFEYKLTALGWELALDPNNILTLTQQQQTFSPSFYYNFTLLGLKGSDNLTIFSIPADNLVVELIVNPLDKNLFYDQQLKINDQVENDFLEQDNLINVTISADAKLFSLTFKTNFTLKFENSVDYSWAIDRLIEGRNIRERIYFPSLISGPTHIYLKNVTLIESTIIINQVISNSSLFDRPVNYFDVILSITQTSIEHSLIFTENAVKRKGLRLTIPYLILGETNPFFLKYDATNDLKIVITDNIRMPLIGYRIELIYFGKAFGTYISNDLTQPMAPAYSNENGEILIENVPNGNYTVKIYQDNVIIMNVIINTFSEVNYINTNVPYFPLWILIFGGINGALILIGLIIYFNHKRRS